MTLDTEEHRAILLELINKSSFAGSGIEKIMELKSAVKEATVVAKPE